MKFLIYTMIKCDYLTINKIRKVVLMTSNFVQKLIGMVLLAFLFVDISVYALLYTVPPFRGESSDWGRDAARICPEFCESLDPVKHSIEWDTNFSCDSQGLWDAAGKYHERAIKCYCHCTDD
jgi:hypothetical protein